MAIFTSQPSPMVRNAARTVLPAGSRDADKKNQAIIEGRIGEPEEHSNVAGDPSDQSPLVLAFSSSRGRDEHPYTKPAVSDAHHNCAHSNA
ncbi:hypothetical protein [Metarhizobium album]|uniref:hypothetical protein n=1 Tax=Metarhizobium album TaxID=2182425 RepID=UPI000FFE75C6|nr:hypothetical protein [Rhizobium album]